MNASAIEIVSISALFVFFFNDTATTEIYTLSLHDALPIYAADHAAPQLRRLGDRVDPRDAGDARVLRRARHRRGHRARLGRPRDRKSTRLNSSHANISYAVFCLKKKKNHTI